MRENFVGGSWRELGAKRQWRSWLQSLGNYQEVYVLGPREGDLAQVCEAPGRTAPHSCLLYLVLKTKCGEGQGRKEMPLSPESQLKLECHKNGIWWGGHFLRLERRVPKPDQRASS